MTTILRLLGEQDQGEALAAAVAAVRQGIDHDHVFAVDPASFRLVPGAPFAYWVSDGVIGIFGVHRSFSASGFSAQVGLQTSGDFRFLRLSWESRGGAVSFCNFAKGGSYSKFYSDIVLCVNHRNDFCEIVSYTNGKYPYLKGNARSLLHAQPELYFRPGLTWPRRTQSGLGMRVLPAGCIFADKGPAAFVQNNDPKDLLALLAITTSAAFCQLVELQMAFGSYEVGVIQRTPVPDLTTLQRDALATLSRRAWSLQRQLDTTTETSHAFALPALLQERTWGFAPAVLRTELATIQADINFQCFNLYGFTAADRQAALAQRDGPAPTADAASTDEDDADTDDETSAGDDPAERWTAVCTWAIGVAFGRFDVRLALAGATRPVEPDPFAPLPACAPGMLAGDDGQPALTPPAGYPHDWPIDGILVDEPGNERDLIGRMRQVFTLVFDAESDARWQEAAVALDPAGHDLRTWLRRQAFERHLKTHSKSRRKAPLYWPLSIPSGRFTVWLYAHRVTPDTAFAIRDRVVAPAAQAEALKLARLTADAGPNPSAAQRRELEDQETLANELRALRDDLTTVAPLLQPFFDDGIVLWSSVLWPFLTTHAAWQKELRTAWLALADGDYDWAHLAMRCWPERVIPKCQADRSLAIAHDLESSLWHQDAEGAWQPTKVSVAEIERLIRERHSPAVVAARDALLARVPTAAARGQGATRSRTASTRVAKAKPAPPPRQAPSAAPVAPASAIDPALADRILAAIAEHPDGAAKSDIQASLGLDDGAWNRAIGALLSDQRVTRTGEKRGTKYHVLNKGAP